MMEALIASILREMGCDPKKPARWVRHYYISKADPPLGGKYEDGWLCSKCGKHSYVRRSVCDGCNSEMPLESEDTE